METFFALVAIPLFAWMAKGIWGELNRDYNDAGEVVGKVVYLLGVIFVIASSLCVLLFNSYITLSLHQL